MDVKSLLEATINEELENKERYLGKIRLQSAKKTVIRYSLLCALALIISLIIISQTPVGIIPALVTLTVYYIKMRKLTYTEVIFRLAKKYPDVSVKELIEGELINE